MVVAANETDEDPWRSRDTKRLRKIHGGILVGTRLIVQEEGERGKYGRSVSVARGTQKWWQTRRGEIPRGAAK